MMLLQVTILHAFKVNGRFYFHLECLFSWKSFLLTNNLWSFCAKRSYIHMYVYSSFELITIFVSTETQMLLICYCCCLRHVYSAVVEFNVQISERKTQFFYLFWWFGLNIFYCKDVINNRIGHKFCKLKTPSPGTLVWYIWIWSYVIIVNPAYITLYIDRYFFMLSLYKFSWFFFFNWGLSLYTLLQIELIFHIWKSVHYIIKKGHESF